MGSLTRLATNEVWARAGLTPMRDAIYHGLLANDIIGFHTRSYQRNFLQCCRDLLDLEVDFEQGVVTSNGREV